MFAFGLLFAEFVLGLVSIANASVFGMIVGVLICMHTMTGFYTYFADKSSKFANFFQSYFAYVVIASFMIIQLANTSVSWILTLAFFIDAFYGLALLIVSYKYQLLSLSLTGKYNYKIIKNVLKPTITKEFVFSEARV